MYHWVAIIDYRIDDDGEFQICVADYHGITWCYIDEFQYGVQKLYFVNEKTNN